MKTVDVTLVNVPGEIARAQQLLEDFAADNALSEDVLFALNVALDEILSNIVNYAYPDNARGQIRLRLSVPDAMAVMELEDDGQPFDPLTLP